MGFVVMQKDGIKLDAANVRTWLDNHVHGEAAIVSWPFEVSYVASHEISRFVKEADWQETRLSMKGISTVDKMQVLGNWLLKRKFDRASIVQVNNYLGALKRGAQIDALGVIQK